MEEKSKTKQALEIEAATKKGEDVIKHGFVGESVSRVVLNCICLIQQKVVSPKSESFPLK